MRSSPGALAACLAVLGLPAWAQVGDGPPAPVTAPPTIYSSAPPSIATGNARSAPRPPTFAAAAPAPATRMAPGAREERMFLRTAAARSRFELEASRLAFAKSGNGAVRALSASLINHHNTAGLELAHLLSSRSMAMPMLSNEQSRVLKQLNKAAGGKFDALYTQHVGMAQAAVARDYEKTGAAILEPQLKAWILRQVAHIRYHQHMFERSSTADAQLAKSNRSAGPPAKPAGSGVQPVATTGGGRLNVSNSR